MIPMPLHLLYLVFEHTLDFVTHGFGAGIIEMDAHLVGSLTDFHYTEQKQVLMNLMARD